MNWSHHRTELHILLYSTSAPFLYVWTWLQIFLFLHGQTRICKQSVLYVMRTNHKSLKKLTLCVTSLQQSNLFRWLYSNSWSCSWPHLTVAGEQSTESRVLTRTTGQMYDGSSVWSLRAPPSHSGFTWDAHLLWSCSGQEKQNHKSCRRHPSVIRH